MYSYISQGNKKLSEKLGSPSVLYTLDMNYIEKASELDLQNPVIYSIYNKLKQRTRKCEPSYRYSLKKQFAINCS